MTFKSLHDLRNAATTLSAGDAAAADAVAARQDMLTKPRGSLGRLETAVAWLARWQGREMPRLDRVKVVVFAGSHGVTAQGVSAYPAEVTARWSGISCRRRGHQPACPRGRRGAYRDSARRGAPDRRFHA